MNTQLQRQIIQALNDPNTVLDLDLFALIVADLHARVSMGEAIDPCYAALVNCLGRQIEDDKDGDPEMVEGRDRPLDVDDIELVDVAMWPPGLFKDRAEIAMQPGSKFFNGYVIGPNEVCG